MVKIDRCQYFFCQESLTLIAFSLENRVTNNILKMAKFGLLAAGAFVLSTALGAAEQADAQATNLMIPHPDGEISIDVSRVAYETQVQIFEQLQGCLQEGFTFADADGNALIEGDEQWDWNDERGFCADTAVSNIEQASLQSEIDVANAEQSELTEEIRLANADQAALRARAEAARQEMQDITDRLISGAQNEG